jgi:hypothetical protein
MDFAPARDDFLPTGFGRGQVPGSSMMAHLIRKCETAGTPRDFLWRGHGKGGETIQNLSAGTVPYQNGISEITRIRDIALSYNRAIRVPAIMWNQGQTQPSTTAAQYRDFLIALRNSYVADLAGILPVGHPAPQILLTQTAAQPNGQASLSAVGQYLAAKADPSIHVAGVLHMYRQTDVSHLHTVETAIMGEYEAKAYYELFIAGRPAGWRPTLWPSSIVRSGTTITMTVARPYGHPLTWDTTTRPAATNMGFAYSGAAISSVAITNAAAGIVTITLASAAAGTLSYAVSGPAQSEVGPDIYSGAWGNLADGDDTPSVTVPGRLLPNRMITFEETVA